MTTMLPPPYELPPFELVRLIHPAFPVRPSPSVPPEVPSVTAFQCPTSNAESSLPGPAGPSGTPGYRQSSHFSERLSHIVSKGASSLSPPSAFDARFSSDVPSGPSTSNSSIGSHEPGTHGLGTAQTITLGQDDLPRQSISTTMAPQNIRSVQAGTESIWVAGNEGSVAVWQLGIARAEIKGKERTHINDSGVGGTVEEAAYLLDQYNVVPSGRPIEKFAVLPTVGKAVVLSEGILTLHALPTFSTIVAFPPVRGVSTFAVDLSNPNVEAVRLCIIKRKAMQLLSISLNQVDMLKELPLRTTAILAVLRRSYLCIADSVNYSLVDLDSATLTPLLPISQDPPDSPSSEMHDLTPSPASAVRPKIYQRPAILSIEEDEFLVASHTASSTLGLFIKENGEPTRGTLEWASNTRSIVVDYPYIVALLQNDTIEVHSIQTQEVIQVLQLSSVPLLRKPGQPGNIALTSASAKAERIQPRSLVSTTSGFPDRAAFQSKGDAAFAPLLVPQLAHTNSLEKIEIELVLRRTGTLSSEVTPEETQVEYVRSSTAMPPSTPRKRFTPSVPVSIPVRPASRSLSTIAAKTLLVGKDSVFALCPLTLVEQAEALIDNNRVEDALHLLDAVSHPDSPEKLDEFCYIKQKAAWKLFAETRFAEACKLFIQGRTDPRLLLRLFPHLTGNLFRRVNVTTVLLFKGLQFLLEGDFLHEQTIDDIIETNLVRNYSPHLPPSSPSVADLHGKLLKDATQMLQSFLASWRNERRSKGLELMGFSGASETLEMDLDCLVDTTLIKLYLRQGKSKALVSDILQHQAHACDVDELAALLEEQSLHWNLSQMLLLRHRLAETLKIWTELVEGKRKDPSFEDGLQKIFGLLESSTDTELVTKYGLWLIGRDRQLGLRILTRPRQGVAIDVESCLSELQAINPAAAESYLETSVYTKREVSPMLHEQLIGQYLDRLALLFETTSLTSELKRARMEYAMNVNTSEVSIVSFILSNAQQSESTAIRAKLILLLHGSLLYDAPMVQNRLNPMPDLLFEQALLAGRLSKHEQVLSILANDLKDLASAEAYCTHAGNGDILSARNVREIVQVLQISPHPSALYRKDGRRRQSRHVNASLSSMQKEEKRRNLLNKLIKIQLQQCSPVTASLRDQKRTAHVIETQAIRISAKEILTSIPDDWPLPLMENFLVRSMRRTLHDRYDRKLVKAVLQSQTLDCSLRYWALTDQLGGVLAEDADDNANMDEKGNRIIPISNEVVYLEEKCTKGLDNEKTIDLQ